MKEGTFIACIVGQQEPLSLISDILQALTDGWGPLVSNEGLLVQKGEPTPTLGGP